MEIMAAKLLSLEQNIQRMNVRVSQKPLTKAY